MKAWLLALALGFVAACSGKEPVSDVPALSPEEALRLLRTDVAALAARPEHHEPVVTIQNLLVGVKGGGSRSQRSPAEAEAFAAEVYARAKQGDDFDLLVKNHSDDAHPGLFTLSLEPSAEPDVYARGKMPLGCGDAAWRLAVGEIGVSPYDAAGPTPRSPMGYHILKRVK
jgi:hypothetical protein